MSIHRRTYEYSSRGDVTENLIIRERARVVELVDGGMARKRKP
jgi:hypothetical protein